MRRTLAVKATNKFAPLCLSQRDQNTNICIRARVETAQSKQPGKHDAELIAAGKKKSIACLLSALQNLCPHLPKFSPSTFVAFDPVSSW
jgi:hypothetical protein